MKKHTQYIIKSIGIIIFIIILLNINYGLIKTTIDKIELKYIFISLILFVPFIIIKTYRWIIILNSLNIKNIKFINCFNLYLIGLYLGNLTPGRLGELVRAIYIKNNEISLTKAVTSVIIDRAYDLVSLIIIGYIGLFFFSHLFENYIMIISLLILITIVSVLIFVFFKRKIMLLVYNFLIPEKIKRKSKEIYIEIISTIKLTTTQDLIYQIVLTFFSWVIYFLFIFFIAKSINLNIGFFYISISIAIATLVTLIPISFNGLGTRDATLLLLYSQLGVSKETTIIFSLMIFIVPFINSIPGLILFLSRPLNKESGILNKESGILNKESDILDNESDVLEQ